MRRPVRRGRASEQPGLQAGPHGAGPQLLKIEETIFLNFSNHAFYLSVERFRRRFCYSEWWFCYSNDVLSFSFLIILAEF